MMTSKLMRKMKRRKKTKISLVKNNIYNTTKNRFFEKKLKKHAF